MKIIVKVLIFKMIDFEQLLDMDEAWYLLDGVLLVMGTFLENLGVGFWEDLSMALFLLFASLAVALFLLFASLAVALFCSVPKSVLTIEKKWYKLSNK